MAMTLELRQVEIGWEVYEIANRGTTSSRIFVGKDVDDMERFYRQYIALGKDIDERIELQKRIHKAKVIYRNGSVAIAENIVAFGNN